MYRNIMYKNDVRANAREFLRTEVVKFVSRIFILHRECDMYSIIT